MPVITFIDIMLFITNISIFRIFNRVDRFKYAKFYFLFKSKLNSCFYSLKNCKKLV